MSLSQLVAILATPTPVDVALFGRQLFQIDFDGAIAWGTIGSNGVAIGPQITVGAGLWFISHGQSLFARASTKLFFSRLPQPRHRKSGSMDMIARNFP